MVSKNCIMLTWLAYLFVIAISENIKKLSINEINEALSTMEGWNKLDDQEAIFKKFEFNDFVDAFSFMSQCSVFINEINHHPQWFNVYNRVEITLSTHDINGVSSLDIQLANKMDQIASNPIKTVTLCTNKSNGAIYVYLGLGIILFLMTTVVLLQCNHYKTKQQITRYTKINQLVLSDMST